MGFPHTTSHVSHIVHFHFYQPQLRHAGKDLLLLLIRIVLNLCKSGKEQKRKGSIAQDRLWWKPHFNGWRALVSRIPEYPL